MPKSKREGGWEREKIKKQKLLKAVAENCHKIDSLFHTATSTPVSKNDLVPSTSSESVTAVEETIEAVSYTHLDVYKRQA